jgi:hypothetical protein
MGWLQEMEASVVGVVVRLGLVRSMKSTVLSRSVAPVVHGVGHVDQQRCAPSDESPVPE